MPKPGIMIAIALAAVLTAGFLLGESLYRNDVVHAIVETADLKDRSCRKANVASGSVCPDGCAIRPHESPSDAKRPTECRSRLWVATCSSDCAPAEGLVRFEDGTFAKSGELIVRLTGPQGDHADAFADMNITFKNGISGLYRYRAAFPNLDDDPEALTEMKAKLEAMSMVESVEYARN